MNVHLLSFASIEAQYICTAVLILVCTLAGALLYLMHRRKNGKTNATNADLQQQNEPDAKKRSNKGKGGKS